MSVAVSIERISNRGEQFRMFASQRDQPSIGLLQPQFHDEARGRQHAGARLGPLDEADGVVEVRLEVGPLLQGETPAER